MGLSLGLAAPVSLIIFMAGICLYVKRALQTEDLHAIELRDYGAVENTENPFVEARAAAYCFKRYLPWRINARCRQLLTASKGIYRGAEMPDAGQLLTASKGIYRGTEMPDAGSCLLLQKVSTVVQKCPEVIIWSWSEGSRVKMMLVFESHAHENPGCQVSARSDDWLESTGTRLNLPIMYLVQ
ncbi:MAG: hypothetical protein GY843_13740 [Neptuniibacter sp.]|nr:hypothetical protein [Neptuniibacter sp.]